MGQPDKKTKLMLESSAERKQKFVSRAIKDPAVKAALRRDQRTKPRGKQSGKQRVA